MSHNTGTVQGVSPVFRIGPDTGAPASQPGVWANPFPHAPAPTGTKFVILHFRNVSLPAANRIEVDLGYDTDTFGASDGSQFWTRPINVQAVGGGTTVPVRYITNGSAAGAAEIDKYGRGERAAGDPGHPSYSNSDPFLTDASYDEPTYDPFWFCSATPVWQNTSCIPTTDVRARMAQSVGMVVTVHGSAVSTCSVTCIGPDLVITAGHCLEDPDNEVPSSSVIFNYAPDCGGNAPAGYAGRFFKVLGLTKYRWDPGVWDYAILQLRVPPSGIGIAPIPLRTDLIPAGDRVFGVHHPNGAIKKLSRPHPGYATVTSSGSFVGVGNLDVSGGSSGSGLFDEMGQYVGVLSAGGSCSLNYFSSASILQDMATTPAPTPARHVMLVVDRSGSMSASAGAGLGSKMDEAREAGSLFVELIRSGSGNRIGLVSFSTNATTPPEFALAAVTPSAKTTLIGPAPFSGGIVGGLAPGGLTSIGGGLDVARTQLSGGGGRDTILLLTDGLQNTPPMIDTVAPGLAGVDVHAIGFGTEASLDGTLLNRLAQEHGGHYTRVGSGLALRKFFALAFGDIFEAGTLADPEFEIKAGDVTGPSLTVPVCGEEAITAVLGWERFDTPLDLRLESPTGQQVTTSTTGVESSRGRTWVFLRLQLPHGGERDGTWNVHVARRPVGGGEFPTTPTESGVRYFVNVIARGGPRLQNRTAAARHYTGDVITPRVFLGYEDGRVPHSASATLTVDVPNRSAGTVLTKSPRVPAVTIAGDTLPARTASLMGLEQAAGQPLIDYATQTHDLRSDPENTDGLFEAPGVFGRRLDQLLLREGNYQFHAKATYGDDCHGARELVWAIHVEVGVDPEHTGVQTETIETLPDGRRRVRIVITPKDRFGNHLGPGKGELLSLGPMPGSDLTFGLTDNGDGTYETVVIWTPGSALPPSVSVTQPGRPPVVLEPPGQAPSAGGTWPNWLFWLLLLIILLLVLIAVLIVLLH